MKKILLSVSLLIASGFAAETFSQVTGCRGGANSCDLTPQDVVVTPITRTCPYLGDNTKIEVIFDVSFKIDANDGNKDIYFHSWLAEDYPVALANNTVFACNGNGTEPALTSGTPGFLGAAFDEAARSFLDIGLINSASLGVGQTQPMTIRATNGYLPDGTVILTSPNGPSPTAPGMIVTKTLLANGLDSISMKNVRVVIRKPSCFAPPPALPNTPASIVVKTLVWATNATDAVRAQCWVSGITQGFNDPLILANKPCSSPRTYTLNISTTNPVGTTLTYSGYIDVNSDGIISAVGAPGGDIEIIPPTNFLNFSSTNPFFTPAPVAYPPYSNTPGIAEKALIFRASTPNIANDIATPAINTQVGCIPLPVEFKSFTAARNRSNVLLKWETTTELNNSGFAVERNINGTWQEVAFVPSQAQNGNSNSLLTYTYNDLNSAKGISQYRIKQIDFDAQSKYSEVRPVRGDGQIGKTIVYPNPTNNGKINVLFEDATVSRNVSVMDMSGRTIKQYRDITNNNLTIENLAPGIYSLRVFVPATGEQAVQKIVVNKQ